jgi:hypothetical protein
VERGGEEKEEEEGMSTRERQRDREREQFLDQTFLRKFAHLYLVWRIQKASVMQAIAVTQAEGKVCDEWSQKTTHPTWAIIARKSGIPFRDEQGEGEGSNEKQQQKMNRYRERRR